MSIVTATAEARANIFDRPRPIKSKARKKSKLTSFNVKMDDEGVARVEHIADRVDPATKTEAFRIAIQITHALIKEYDEGATFYIKRGDSEELELLEIVG